MLIVQAIHDNVIAGFLSSFDRLTVADRLNARSGWELVAPIGSEAAALLSVENRHGIRVLIPGPPTWVWSGSVRKIEVDDDSGLVAFSGPSHLSWLDRRHIRPPVGEERVVATGPAAVAVAEIVSSQAGPTAAASRYPFLSSVAADAPAAEQEIEVAGRHTPLLATIGARATAHDLSIGVASGGRGSLDCTVRQARQHPHIVFDERHSLGRVGSQASDGNALIGGAGGDGAAREFVVRDGTGAASKWDRVEGFLDVGSPNLNDVDETAEAVQKLDDEIEANKAVSSAELVVAEHDDYRFGPDYQTGDYVALRRGGTRRMSRVTGVDIEASSTDASIRALVGDVWSPLERVIAGDDAVEEVR